GRFLVTDRRPRPAARKRTKRKSRRGSASFMWTGKPEKGPGGRSERDRSREMRRLPGRMTDRTRSRRDRKIFCRRRNHSRRKMITETHHRREKTNRKGKSRETRITRYSVPAMTMKIPAVRKSSRAVTTGKNRMTGRKETGRSQVLPFPITEI